MRLLAVDVVNRVPNAFINHAYTLDARRELGRVLRGGVRPAELAGLAVRYREVAGLSEVGKNEFLVAIVPVTTKETHVG